MASHPKTHGVYVCAFPSKTSHSSAASVERVPNSNFTILCLILVRDIILALIALIDQIIVGL
jgi:hypothetical protein